MSTITSFVDTMTRLRKGDTDKVVYANVCDFALYNATSGDTVQLLKVADNDLITDVWAHVVTAEGTASTGSLGDGDDLDGWNVGIDLNAATGTTPLRSVEADAYGLNGKSYTADDTIDLLPAQSLSTLKLLVIAEGVHLQVLD